MHKFAALGLLLAAGLMVTLSLAEATEGPISDPGVPAGARYEAWGDHGLVSVAGLPGDAYEVFDSTGMMLK